MHDPSWVITSDTRREDLEEWAYWEKIDASEAHVERVHVAPEPEPEPELEAEPEPTPDEAPEPVVEQKPARRSRTRKADA
ncbi:hypothetical protein [Prescottella agglutinans]|nr:hypothetical protein [Prescottella agglutinans]